MNATQALNGTRLPAIVSAPLSESDRAAVESIYGPTERYRFDRRRILNNQQGNLLPRSRACLD